MQSRPVFALDFVPHKLCAELWCLLKMKSVQQKIVQNGNHSYTDHNRNGNGVSGSNKNGHSLYNKGEIWEIGKNIPKLPDYLPEPQISETASYIAKTRYARRNEKGTPTENSREMFWRVAYNISSAELLYNPDKSKMLSQAEKFYQIMSAQKFIPNTPTMLNAGKPMQQLSACFVLPIEDTLAGIGKTLVDMVLIHKSGGGTGFSFSRLRPYGDIIQSSGGQTVGPCSFLQAYNDVTSQVKQGGVRRGANMGILHITHPDILRFAVMKVDEFNLTNFNISVTVTEEWMEQVAKDAVFVSSEPAWDEIIEEVKEAQKIRDIDLKLKKTEDGVGRLYDICRATKDGEGYDLINPRTGEVANRLNAQKVFLLITKLAWQYGDPGMIMIDRINKSAANPTPNLGQIEATNPCLTADTWIHTKQGPQQVKELIGTQFFARVNGSDFPSTGFFKTATKEVVRLQTKEGYTLRLTSDHRVARVKRFTRHILETEWCEAGHLHTGDNVVLNNHQANIEWKGKYTYNEGYLLGLLVGDGTLKQDKAVLSVWQSEPVYSLQSGAGGMMHQVLEMTSTMPHRKDFRGWTHVKGRAEYRLSLGYIKQLALSLGMRPGKKVMTEAFEKTSSDFYRGFLGGLFDTDGSVQGTQTKGVSIILAQSSLSNLQAVQRMLLRLGITSSIYKNRRLAGLKLLPNGKGGQKMYKIRAQHELVVSGEGILRFHELVNFADTNKSLRLKRRLSGYKRTLNRERFVATVAKIGNDGIEDVFDAQVLGANSFDANGLYVHNCGEQPLLPYDACTLGSINVGKFVHDGKIDWDGLGEVTNECVRFLDNVLDMNNYPIPEIFETTRKIRRIGLGVMGFADLLVRLGIGYNTNEGLQTAEELMEFIQRKAKEASCKLAEERGAFPGWKGSIYDPESPHFAGVELKIRNGAVTTIAPTGTIAMLADASSGIEPYFALSYAKNTIEGKRLFTANPYFLEIAKREDFYSDELLAKIEENGGSVQGLREVPERWQKVFATTRDITPEWHVMMQAAFQKHVDNAISKTVNFANNATVEDVRRAYMMVYETGCKGITIYRDGSRQKQVLEVKKDKSYYDQLVRSGGHKRSLSLRDEGVEGDEGRKEEHQLVVGPVKAPEEAWGMRIKKKSDVGSVYTAVFKNEMGQPVEVFINVGKAGGYVAGAAEVTGRLASRALKHGATLEEVAHDLVGIACGTPYGVGPNAILSMFDAVGKSILEISHTKQLPLAFSSKGEENTNEIQSTSNQLSNGEEHTNGNAKQQSGGVLFDKSSVETYQSLFVPCPDCGSPLLVIEGCKKCSNPGCGYSKC